MLGLLQAVAFYHYTSNARKENLLERLQTNSERSRTSSSCPEPVAGTFEDSTSSNTLRADDIIETADNWYPNNRSEDGTELGIMSVEMIEDDGVQRGKGDVFNINRKIFVGNISYRIKSRKLTKFFWKFGPVEHCYIVKDHLKGWSRGIAFITFRDEESMKKALQAADEELVLDERQMRVKPAELSNKTTFWQNNSSSEGEENWDDPNQSASTDQSHDHSADQSEVTNGPNINDLFDELLIHIFTMMSFRERVGIERVCRRWKNIVQASWVTYKSLSFHNFFRKFGGLRDRNLNSALQRCGQYLECLDLSGSPALLTDFSMNVIGNYCPGLRELDVSSVKITDVSVKNLVSKCNKLKKVTLKRCMHITEGKGVKLLIKNNPELEYIDLSYNVEITGKCFKEAGANLKSVILSKCLMVTDKCLFHLGKNCPHLEELNLSNCKGLTSEGLKHIVQDFSTLKVLDIGSSGVFNNSADPAVALRGVVNLKNMEYLDVSNCLDFNDDCLILIAQNCPRLRHLDISACSRLTNEGMTSLGQLHLQTLNISFLNRPNQIGNGLVKIAVAGALRRFIARASSFITNQVVMEIVASSPDLEFLDLSDCFNITNEIFKAFKNSAVDESKTVELYLGGTSVDWVGEDIDWVSGFSHLKVFMIGSLFYQTHPMFEMDNLSDEEDQYAAHRPISNYLPEGPVESCDDWEEGYEMYDDFLDNDDPLEAERWNMS